VYCQLVYLRGCPPRRLRRALSETPEMLDKMYERILQDIKTIKWESAHILFQCVAVASRPLHVAELAEFLAFDFETGPIPKFHEGWRLDNPLHAVLSISSTLLTAIKVEHSRVIQFTHFSAKEFLTSTRLAQTSDVIYRRFHVSMTLAHTLVSQACLGILLHIDENITSDSLQHYPLAAYAAEHWVFHTRFENVFRNVEDGIKLLFHPKKPHFAIWLWLYDLEVLGDRTERPERPLQPRGTPLHYAALCGLDTIVNFLLVEHSQDVDALGFDDNSTPLHLASGRGYVDVARILLEHGADATHQDEFGLTPLHRASQNGHLEVVRLLLEHGTDVNARDHSYWTTLHEASQEGHLDMVHILLEHGANTHALDHGGWTPLLSPSHNGHLAVVLVLIKYGADANTGDNSSWTPLHSASQEGHSKVAQALLEHGADANSMDGSNQTPLHLASRAGYVGLVRLLVEHGAAASIHVRNNENRTPFQEASEKGHRDVVQLLSEYGAQED
jgi:ankyrin repeat protein